MSFTVTDFDDLLRLIEEQPEWRARLRSVVLTDDLLALPEVVRQLAEAQRATEARVEELAVAQRRTENEIADLVRVTRRLVADVGRLQGSGTERRYREHATGYFGSIIRRVRVLSDDDYWGLLDPALERGLVSRSQERELALADLLLRGRMWDDGREVYLVVEASQTIGNEDVERAARRAALLGQVGVEAIAVVAGDSVAAGVPSWPVRR